VLQPPSVIRGAIPFTLAGRPPSGGTPNSTDWRRIFLHKTQAACLGLLCRAPPRLSRARPRQTRLRRSRSGAAMSRRRSSMQRMQWWRSARRGRSRRQTTLCCWGLQGEWAWGQLRQEGRRRRQGIAGAAHDRTGGRQAAKVGAAPAGLPVTPASSTHHPPSRQLPGFKPAVPGRGRGDATRHQPRSDTAGAGARGDSAGGLQDGTAGLWAAAGVPAGQRSALYLSR
jgi:hypothetical protein